MIVVAVIPLMILFLIAAWIKELPEKARKERLAGEREQERAKNIIEAEKRQEREKIEAEGRRLKQQEELDNATNNGIDVCIKCKTIRPKRCDCGKCINKYQGNGCYYGNGCPDSELECNSCYIKRRTKICEKAESDGKDVCWSCLAVEPYRCFHGRCDRCDYCSDCND